MAVDRQETISALYAKRPRDRFVRASLWLFFLLIVGSWIAGRFSLTEILSARRLGNLERFLNDITPFDLRNTDWGITDLFGWAAERMSESGWEAAGATIAIAVVAIFIASAASLPLSFAAARRLMNAEPFLPNGAAPSRARRFMWRAFVLLARILLILLRAMPEYLLAFLALALFGASAWPAVIALAIHNAGILGRLKGEVIENTNARSLSALRGVGASRRQISLFGVMPLVLPRFLLYDFYRWESCVREATVLGMLGFASLGAVVVDARTREKYDEFVFFILLGCAIVVVGDLISALARSIVRRAS
ncbi:MAG: ABC transporter permease subunit [Planctomycetota bacterium]